MTVIRDSDRRRDPVAGSQSTGNSSIRVSLGRGPMSRVTALCHDTESGLARATAPAGAAC